MDIALTLVGTVIVLAVVATLLDWIIFRRPAGRNQNRDSEKLGDRHRERPATGNLLSNPERFLPPDSECARPHTGSSVPQGDSQP